MAATRSETSVGRLWAVLVLTGLFMVVETIGGWLAGSLALLADAGHNLGDVPAPGSPSGRRITSRPTATSAGRSWPRS